MKKYKMGMMAVGLFYAVLAVLVFFCIKMLDIRQESAYKVDINRIYNALENVYEREGRLKESDLRQQWENSTYIEAVIFLPEEAGEEEIEKFYEPKNGFSMEIKPLWEAAGSGRQIAGYFRLDYEKKVSTNGYLFAAEASLFLLFLVVFLILFYIYEKIIKPFLVLSEMPFELSKGNLNQEMKESKNRYFGKFIWGIGMLKDTLEVHKKQELKLAKDKKMILLSISHDIKTPLHTINLYTRALKEGLYKTDEEMKEAAEHIEKKTEEINGFVQEIIKSSTEEVISIEVTVKEFYLSELVEKIKMAYGEKCSRQKVAFFIGVYENYLLKGDPDRLYEAVGNLMENAFKYGDGKEIRITFALEDYCLLLSIYNSGNPVEEKDMVHLFESFYRGSNTNGKQGNGLGLYICSEIMKKMQGDIFAKRFPDGMEMVLVCPLS